MADISSGRGLLEEEVAEGGMVGREMLAGSWLADIAEGSVISASRYEWHFGVLKTRETADESLATFHPAGRHLFPTTHVYFCPLC